MEKKEMVCRNCKGKMELDDTDYNFKGNYNEYYICKNDDCDASCIKQVRYSKVYKVFWLD